MAIAHYNPETPVLPGERHSVVTDPRKHAVYDDEQLGGVSLEGLLSGSPWMVRAYYRQVLGVADTPRDLDINLSAAYQHYEKIERLELLVKTPLEPSYDSKSHISALTGTSIIYSFMKPNVSDYFITETNVGRLGLIKVTTVERARHEKDSVWIINYEQIEEITEEHPKYINLEEKSKHVSVFSKERLQQNQNPVLLKSRYVEVHSLKDDFKQIANYYWRSFFRPERGTLFLPGQDRYIYDPFLVQFVNRVIDSSIVPDIRYLTLLSENNDPAYEIDTIWKNLERRGLGGLSYIRPKMMLVTPPFFDHIALARSAFFANADWIVYPKEYDKSAHNLSNSNWGVHNSPGHRYISWVEADTDSFDFNPTTNALGESVSHMDHMLTIHGNDFPAYTNVMAGDSYIFPPSFYEKIPSSVLECVLLDYLDRRPIDIQQLKFLIETFPKIGRMEQFYFGPMVLVCIKEALRGAYA